MEGYPHMQGMHPGMHAAMHPGMHPMAQGMMLPPGMGHDGPPWKRQRLDEGPFSGRGNKQDSIFYKTRMCNRWQEGSCTFGDRCNYAHGEQELRELPAEGHEILQKRAARQAADQGMAYQGPAETTKSPELPPRPPIVSKFSDPVSHTASTASATASMTPPGGPDVPRDAEQQDGGPASGGSQDRAVEQRKGQFYKSRLCHAFMRGAPCGYGDRCQYAHGHEELRMPHREGMRGMPGPGFHPGMMDMAMGGMGPMDMFPPGMAGMGRGGPMGVLPFPGGPMMAGMGAGPGPMRPPPPRPPPGPGPGPPSSIGTPGSETVSPTPGKMDAFSPTQSAPDVPLIERVRATCLLLGLGALKSADVSKAAMDAAVTAIQTGEAFRQSPYADAVSLYMH